MSTAGVAIDAVARNYRLGEFHRFEAAGAQFLYLVRRARSSNVDDAVGKLIDCLTRAPLPHRQLIERSASGWVCEDAEELVSENCISAQCHSWRRMPRRSRRRTLPEDFPLQTLVMNLTNQCNLSCQYCYEFGEDKVATPEGKPKFMDMETAKASVDFLLAQSGGRRSIHITFFGGETLMNFPLLKQVVGYASEQAHGAGAQRSISA